LRRAISAIVVLAIAALLPACGPPDDPERRPNVLLISIDALRGDRLSCAGYDRHTTPFLDRLGAGGIRFSQTFVNTHGTPPSHATLFSSLYQQSHRVGMDAGPEDTAAHRLPESIELLPEILARGGWTTVAVTGGGYLSQSFGYARGFQSFSDQARNIEQGTAMLIDALAAAPHDQPVFAFYHSYQVHSPYTPPEAYQHLFGEHDSSVEPTSEALLAIQTNPRKRLDRRDFDYLEALYDREIRYTDDTLGAMFDRLEASGFLDHAIVVVTSDHGEEFGDHGGLLHGGSLFDELLHVPMIVSGSGIPSGVVDPRLASTIDVAPTILGAVGIEPPPQMEGSDLLAAAAPDWSRQRVFSQYGSSLYSVRSQRWKLILRGGGRVLLFDLRRDPAEQRNVSDRFPDVTDRLRSELRSWRSERPRLDLESATSIKLSKQEEQRLKALGYVD
jgi:arylsulfatase A-like enzyme